MDPIAALTVSRREFESRLGHIGEDQWNQPTPCAEWSVRDLVNHVMLGTRMSVQLLAGASREDVIAGFGDDLVRGGDDTLSDFAALADQMHEAFAGPGGLDGTVSHPMGDIPRSQFVGFRIGDYTAHAWDLARAIGADEELDAELVSYAWDDMQPMVPMIEQSGMFGDGPSGRVGADAPLQIRFLDLIGRRP